MGRCAELAKSRFIEPELAGKPHSGVRVSQMLAPEQHDVSLPCHHDRLRLGGARDQPDRRRRGAGARLDLVREPGLIARADRDLRPHVSAGRDIDHRRASIEHPRHDRARLIEIPANDPHSFSPIWLPILGSLS